MPDIPTWYALPATLAILFAPFGVVFILSRIFDALHARKKRRGEVESRRCLLCHQLIMMDEKEHHLVKESGSVHWANIWDGPYHSWCAQAKKEVDEEFTLLDPEPESKRINYQDERWEILSAGRGDKSSQTILANF